MSTSSVRHVYDEQPEPARRKPVARAICSAGFIRLPRSAVARSGVSWIKLLKSVNPTARDGFGFEGKVLRPGGELPADELPHPAILLECAGSESTRGHKRGECLYILWRWDRELKDWTDVAQAKSVGPEWALALRDIACRELQTKPAETFNAEAAAHRIVEFINNELRRAPPPDRRWIAGYLHDHLAQNMVA